MQIFYRRDVRAPRHLMRNGARWSLCRSRIALIGQPSESYATRCSPHTISHAFRIPALPPIRPDNPPIPPFQSRSHTFPIATYFKVCCHKPQSCHLLQYKSATTAATTTTTAPTHRTSGASLSCLGRATGAITGPEESYRAIPIVLFFFWWVMVVA